MLSSMTAFLPCSDPGGCRNERPSVDAYGDPAGARCRELDDVPRICRFPASPPRLPSCATSASRPLPVPGVPPARSDDVQAGSDRAFAQATSVVTRWKGASCASRTRCRAARSGDTKDLERAVVETRTLLDAATWKAGSSVADFVCADGSGVRGSWRTGSQWHARPRSCTTRRGARPVPAGRDEVTVAPVAGSGAKATAGAARQPSPAALVAVVETPWSTRPVGPGVSRSSVVPSPSWPCWLPPQVHRAPVASIA